jgi:transposase
MTGSSLLLDMPCCDTECFEAFLNELSKQQPNEYKILFLDNGAFHKAKRLLIPDNIALCFLPPYSPELNPAEKVWAFLKRKITNKAFKTLGELQKFMDSIIQKYLSIELVKSITNTATYGMAINKTFIG